jgi:hypothetical protein
MSTLERIRNYLAIVCCEDQQMGGTATSHIVHRRLLSLLSGFMLLAPIALIGCASSSYESRTFFRKEYGLDTHGKKTLFDHLVEADPGRLKVHLASNYEQVAPLRIAVLPFSDRGSANFVVNKIPLTFRNKEQRADWAWTDGNRMRRALNGYLASREFVQANLIQVDAILKEQGIDTKEKLDAVPPETLGKWLGVDAVIYGEIRHYEAYYVFLIAAWQVGADVKMVSTRTGEELYSANGGRYSVDLRPAFDLISIAINSGLSLLELRDISLARAEEEDAREIGLRIPRSEKLGSQLIELAHDNQVELDFAAQTKSNSGVADSRGLPRRPAEIRVTSPSPNTQP